MVSRPRLVERLTQGAERKLTLVSAPAGFGKTTLLAEWLARGPASEEQAAWVSLDRRDNDPALFWAYVVTALQKAAPGLGDGALSLLYAPQATPIESMLTILMNDFNTVEGQVALVLDDYHVIDRPEIHEGLAFLLDHLPPRMRLIVSSRSSPPLPLARLRGRGELSELRAADLRFRPDEVASFLNDVMGLKLGADDVEALETRTEGWIVGLQMAALSMQGREDVTGFIQAFAGDDRYIVDYLVEEVLQRQSEHVRNFLLRTSILDRLSGPLCDAVTEQDNGRGMLEALERGNLFVVSLDDRRQWYRYHHLFADVLGARLQAEQPELVRGLHRRASDWCERNGLTSEAIQHALASGDIERAAVLVELAWSAMHRSFQDSQWLGWAGALPAELVRARPVLSAGYAWALLNSGDLEAGELWLQTAEEGLTTAAHVADEREFRLLPVTIATARAFHAGALGDAPAAVRHARLAMDLLAATESDPFVRGRAAAILGLVYWASGELEAAYETFADGIAKIRGAGKQQHLQTLSAEYVLAEIRVAQGRLREAARTYEQSLQLVAEQGDPASVTTVILHAGISEVHRERGDLQAATRHLRISEQMNEHRVSYEPRWFVARARLALTQGEPEDALDLLDEAERLFNRDPVPKVRSIAALKARVWITQGRLAEALAWAREQGLTVDDELSYLHEFEHLTLAKVLIAHHRSVEDTRAVRSVLGLLQRLLDAAQATGRAGSEIEILVQQALAHEALGDVPRARLALERALALAAPEGYVRVFVDEGEPMRGLLRDAAVRSVAGFYPRHLLAVFDEADAALSSADKAQKAGLVDPLTARESEVLRLIAAGLRNQQIADQLFISLATVKRHIANIYGKLGVNHRTEAVARANELRLL